MNSIDAKTIEVARELADMTNGMHSTSELAEWLIATSTDDFAANILGGGDRDGYAYSLAAGKASGYIMLLLDIIDRQQAAINRAETINAELADKIESQKAR